MKAPRSHEAEMRPKNNEVGRKRMSLFIQQVEKEGPEPAWVMCFSRLGRVVLTVP